MVAAVIARRRWPVAPVAWSVALILSVAAALGWPSGPLIVGGVEGEPFGIGPLLPGWSLRQTVSPERGPELFIGFQARPTTGVEAPPTLEVRLERADALLWADRLRLTGSDMTEYVATFPVATDGGDYVMAVRVLEAAGGGVVLRGVETGEPTATTQLSIMGRQLRGFLALGHRTFQRVPPARHLEALGLAVEEWTVKVAAGVGILAALAGAVGGIWLARAYGRVVAAAAALAGASGLALWLFVAVVHLSVPSVAGVDIGVLRGLTPTGIAALLAFPIVVVVGYAVMVVAAPRAVLNSALCGVQGLWLAAVTAIRHWYLAPIPLGGAAAAAVTQGAEEVATALAFLTGAWALLGVAATAAVARRGRSEEAAPEAPECDVSVVQGTTHVTR